MVSDDMTLKTLIKFDQISNFVFIHVLISIHHLLQAFQAAKTRAS